jgi:4-amino-4-deoxy-L-arabinose transferase-like glycosyltransferase
MTTRGGPRGRVVAAAIALGVALRLAFGLGYWVGKDMTRDEVEYLSLARSLAAGHGFVFDERVRSGPVEPFGRAPGYPFWLALTGGGRQDAGTHVPTSIKIVQSLAGGAGIAFIAIWTARLAGGRAAELAALFAAVYPPLVWMAAYALSEAVFWPIALAAAWALDRAIDDTANSGRRGRPIAIALAAGVALGVAVLFRAATVLLIGVAGLWLLWRRRLTVALLLGVGALAVIGPWTLRNYRHYGRFVLVATDGGVTFWTGNNALATGEGDMAANPDLKRASLALRAANPGLDEEAMEPVYYREALAWMRENPLAWAALEMKKLFYLLVPIGPSYRLHSPLYFWGSVIPYALLAPLAIAGAWRFRSRLPRVRGLWLLLGSAVAVCLVFFPQERFRTPVIDSAIVVWAAATLAGRSESGPLTRHA